MFEFTWDKLRELIMIFIGVGIILFLLHLNNEINQTEEETRHSIANSCRLLRAHDQPLVPNGPCFSPEIKVLWEDLPVKVIVEDIEHAVAA